MNRYGAAVSELYMLLRGVLLRSVLLRSALLRIALLRLALLRTPDLARVLVHCEPDRECLLARRARRVAAKRFLGTYHAGLQRSARVMWSRSCVCCLGMVPSTCSDTVRCRVSCMLHRARRTLPGCIGVRSRSANVDSPSTGILDFGPLPWL